MNQFYKHGGKPISFEKLWKLLLSSKYGFRNTGNLDIIRNDNVEIERISDDEIDIYYHVDNVQFEVRSNIFIEYSNRIDFSRNYESDWSFSIFEVNIDVSNIA